MYIQYGAGCKVLGQTDSHTHLAHDYLYYKRDQRCYERGRLCYECDSKEFHNTSGGTWLL